MVIEGIAVSKARWSFRFSLESNEVHRCYAKAEDTAVSSYVLSMQSKTRGKCFQDSPLEIC